MRRGKLTTIGALLFTGATLFATPGCNTPANTQNPTLGDLLFRHGELQEYLETRRQALAGLQQRSKELDSELVMQLGALNRMEKDLQKAEAVEVDTAVQIETLKEQIAKRKALYQELWLRTVQTQQAIEEKETHNDIDAGELERDRDELKQLEKELSELESQNKQLDNTINGTLQLRVKQIPKSE